MTLFFNQHHNSLKHVKIKIVFLTFSLSGEKFTWSSPDAKAQADKTSCKPLQKYENAAMKSILDSTNMQRTSLGAVDNAEVNKYSENSLKKETIDVQKYRRCSLYIESYF